MLQVHMSSQLHLGRSSTGHDASIWDHLVTVSTEDPKFPIWPAKIHKLGQTCAAFPQCASSTLPTALFPSSSDLFYSFSSLLLTLLRHWTSNEQGAKISMSKRTLCKILFDQDTLSGCNTTIRARFCSMGPQRSSCKWRQVTICAQRQTQPPKASRIHAAVGASTEPKGSLDDIGDPKLPWMARSSTWPITAAMGRLAGPAPRIADAKKAKGLTKYSLPRHLDGYSVIRMSLEIVDVNMERVM